MSALLSLTEAQDKRSVSPDDLRESLATLIEEGRVQEAVLLTCDAEGEMLIGCTDMTNTQLLGFIEMAKLNYVHQFQHEGG